MPATKGKSKQAPAAAAPAPKEMAKIKNLVIVMMENRSFDHFLGSLSLAEGRKDVDGLTKPLPTLADSAGKQYTARDMGTTFAFPDPPHEFKPAHADWNGGKHDGFVKQYEAAHPPAKNPGIDLSVPLGYYTRATLPTLYALADQFTLCDHWHSSVLSSTWPNRKYLHSGCRDADKDTQTLPPFPGFKTRPIWDFLEDEKDPDTKQRLTWKCYFTDLPFLSFWYTFAARHALSNFHPILQFAEDCFADTLPTFSIVDPAFSVADDHPAYDPQLGEKWLALVIDALTVSEAWRHTALLLLYDENGGFYDHVKPPPAAVARPDVAPEDDRLGFRVPAFVVSPYPVKGRAVKTVFDHTSLLRTIASRWRIDFPPEFGARWRTMPDIWTDCFDFAAPPLGPGIYTGQPLRDLNFSSGVQDRLQAPPPGFGGLLERIFLLPELKLLDRRAQVYEILDGLETRVINMKRTIRS